MMKEITVVLTLLACSVFSLEDKHEKDKTIFNEFLAEIYGNVFEMETFIDMIWPNIHDIVPGTIVTPPIEVADRYSDNYVCGTNAAVHLKVGEIINKNLIFKSKDKVTFEVDAKLFLNTKPVEFGIAEKLDNGDASPTVPMSFHFDDPFRVRIVLEIFNFKGKQRIVTPRCLVRVKSILIVDISEPEILSEPADEKAEAVEEHFLQHFNIDDVKAIGTVGLVKALNERLNANASFWICSSKSFDRMEEAYKKEWEYTENFKKVCLKKGNNW